MAAKTCKITDDLFIVTCHNVWRPPVDTLTIVSSQTKQYCDVMLEPASPGPLAGRHMPALHRLRLGSADPGVALYFSQQSAAQQTT